METAEHHTNPAAFPFQSYAEFAVHNVVIQAMRILQWVLLCAQVKASALDKMSWWAVFVPAWLLVGYGMLRLLLRVVRMRSAGSGVEVRAWFCCLLRGRRRVCLPATSCCLHRGPVV